MTENKGVVVNKQKYLTAQEIQANARLIQDVMKSVMTKDTDFGVVPGTNSKPTLLKPGGEKLAMLFRTSKSTRSNSPS